MFSFPEQKLEGWPRSTSRRVVSQCRHVNELAHFKVMNKVYLPFQLVPPPHHRRTAQDDISRSHHLSSSLKSMLLSGSAYVFSLFELLVTAFITVLKPNAK